LKRINDVSLTGFRPNRVIINKIKFSNEKSGDLNISISSYYILLKQFPIPFEMITIMIKTADDTTLNQKIWVEFDFLRCQSQTLKVLILIR